MSRYFIATLTIDHPEFGKQTIIGCADWEAGASAHFADVLESYGYTPAQIGKLLARGRVSEVKQRRLGATLVLSGELNHDLGKLTHWRN